MMRAASFTLALALALTACSPSKGPQTGSQTNWLTVCDSSADCGELECLCGACTATCANDDSCSELAGASCVVPSDEGSIALCGGQRAEQSICLPRCEATCAEGTSCIAGVCAPIGTPTAHVQIDIETRHQELVGFGASLAYAEDMIVARPDKAELFDLLFDRAGLDAIRLGNRYQSMTDAPVASASEIATAATERLGRRPFLFMTSGTPPPALKANGERACGGDYETCTLATLSGGGFDYAGFASYWRDSLQAYASAGLVPDYISIQNNPNGIPPAETPGDACRFLPAEGTQRGTVDGTPIDVSYPGYREALAAVRAASRDLPGEPPRLAGPALPGLGTDLSAYAAPLETGAIDAIALHLYGQDPSAIDDTWLQGGAELAQRLDRPLFQTEMQADGLDTAVLMHHALTVANASAYLQNDLVSWAPEAADVSLVLLADGALVPQGPYYAFIHFAQHTDPGWVRVGAVSDRAALLGSAWLSPAEDALTIVLVNSGDVALEAELALSDAVRSRLSHTEVLRTVFEGIERYAALGALADEGVVHVPPRSIVTATLASE